MKNIIYFLMMVVLISLCCAEPLFIYEINDPINLAVPCINNDEQCSSAAKCLLTVFYPDTTIFIDNVTMENNLAFHNYTLNSTIGGEYQNIVYCTDGSEKGYSTFTFLINDKAEYNKYIKDTKWFNVAAMDLTTTAGVMVLILTFFIWFCLIMLAEVIKIPIFMLLMGIFGFFLGILLYVVLSSIVGIFFVFLSIMYMIRALMEAK